MECVGLERLSAPLDARIERILIDAKIPGAAIAVVHNGRSYIKTHGVRRIGDSAPVTPHTAFDLGSCSKSYVASVVSLLVRTGKLGYDDAVQKYLPELQLDTPDNTAQLTIRDLLCNRIGFKRQIPVESFANPELSALDIMRRIGKLDRAYPLREGYVYFNPGFMACRLIVERVSGLGYGDFLQQELFGPLGMTNSASGSVRVEKFADRACGHVLWQNERREVHEDLYDNWQGAAGVHSSALDATRWLAYQLGGAHAETHQPHTLMPRAECKLIHAPPGAQRVDYCLGWWRTALHDRPLVQHAGEMFGWRAHHALLPEDGIGVSVMLNMGAPRHAAIAYTVLETLLTGASRDWCAVADEMQTAQNLSTQSVLEAAFPATAQAALPMAAYSGRYAHAALGIVEITHDGGQLRLRFHDGRLWDQGLRHLGGHVFETRPLNLAVADYFPLPLRLRFEIADNKAVAMTDLQARYERYGET